ADVVQFDAAGMRQPILVRRVGGDGLPEHALAVEDLGDASVLHFRKRLTLPPSIPHEVVADHLVRHLLDQTPSFALANIKHILESSGESRVRSFVDLARAYLEEGVE